MIPARGRQFGVVLLLAEPVNGLDPEGVLIRTLMRSLAVESTGMIRTTLTATPSAAWSTPPRP
jgi:hypothetical protein